MDGDIFTDDARTLAELLRQEWGLGPGKEPSIAFDVQAQMMSSRYAAVFVYMMSRSSNVSTTDYRTLERVSRLGIRVTAPYRENFIEVCQEVTRILMSHRRAGKRRLNGYTFLEVTGERFGTDLSGWHACTYDVKMTSYNTPVYDSGTGHPLGDGIDRATYDYYEGKEFEDSCQE